MSAKRSSVGRPIVSLLLIMVCLGIGPGVHPARAQSLADVAKKEEARRKTVPAAAKVYTNKDLNAQPSPPPADEKAGGAAKDTKDSKDAADVKDKQSVKDKAYWSGRLTKLQEQVDRDEASALAIQTRNSVAAEVVKSDDPAQRDPAQRVSLERERLKSVAELSRLTKAIADGKKSIADVEEEARRAGVPPGWLR